VAPSVESDANHNATSSDPGHGQAQNGLYEDEVLQLVWTLCPPDCVDIVSKEEQLADLMSTD